MSLKGDYVTIINTSTEGVDISGYILESVVGRDQEFTFPSETTLPAGASCTVWSGRGSDQKHNPPVSFFWTKKNIWNDDGDKAVLKDKDGRVLDSVEEKPPVYEGHLEIQELNLVGDYVTIINKTNKDSDISGYCLKSVIGSQSFIFPPGTELKAGCTITVWSGRDSDKRNAPPSSLAWTKRFIWNDSGDCCALYNSAGELVSVKQYFPVKIPEKITPPTQ